MLELIVAEPKKLELKDSAPLPAPSGDEVKIRLIYGGICGSDLGVYKGKVAYARYPVRAGHELVGTIIEKGEKAPFTIGTRVVVLPNTYCSECDKCRKGLTNICENKRSLGINMDGGFAQEFTLSSKYVLEVPEDLPDEKAILVEPLAVVVHAFNKAAIGAGTKVAVVGCGNEGLLAVALARYLGADVTAVDINPAKFKMARKIDAEIRTCYFEELRSETFDVVFEMSGVEAGVQNAVQLVEPGGTLILVGLAPEARLPIYLIARKEMTIHGSIIYQFPQDYQKAVEYLRDPGFHSEPVVSEILPFKEYEKAYELAASSDTGKIVMSFKEVDG